MSHVTYLTWLEAVADLTGMASLLFRLRGGSPRNGPLVIDPHALAEALNQKGGRGAARLRPEEELCGSFNAAQPSSACDERGFGSRDTRAALLHAQLNRKRPV